MKAITVKEAANRTLLWQDGPDPTFAPNEALVNIHTTAINRADLLQRAGNYPPPPGAPPYMGLEMCGTIAEVGDAVTGFKPGDRVLGLLSGGGYAEPVAVPATHLLPLPDDRDFVWGGAIAEVFLTAFVNLFLEAGLRAGEPALIHGGASGIGTTAVMLAHQFGHTVFTTAGSDRKCEAVRKLGSDHVINYQTDDFVEVVAQETGGKGVDVILDFIGGDYLPRNIACLARNGRLVNIAYMKGSTVEVDFLPVMLKHLTLTGSTLRARPVKEKARIADDLKKKVWPLLEKGEISPVIDSVYKLSEAAEAHQRMEQSEHVGKILLEI